MPPESIAAIMIHVADVPAAFAWYQRAFPNAVHKRIEAQNFGYLAIDEINLELVPADDKVASGAAGSIVYWRVPDFDKALQRLQDIGATLYRGPMEIENGHRMCQVRDPWGNCLGLRGP